METTPGYCLYAACILVLYNKCTAFDPTNCVNRKVGHTLDSACT